MKKALLLLPVLLLSTFLFSFNRGITGNNLPFCTAFNKVLQGAVNNFKELKGEYEDSFDDGTKEYKLKLEFDGWKNNYYMVEPNAIYIEISTGLLGTKEAESFFNKAASLIEDCLGSKRETLMKGDLKLYKFYKGKTEITLMYSENDKEQPIMLTFENI